MSDGLRLKEIREGLQYGVAGLKAQTVGLSLAAVTGGLR